MLAFPGEGGLTRERVRWLAGRSVLLAFELLVFFAFFGLYFLGRGMVVDRPRVATDNALWIIDVQQTLGIFVEPSWHEWAMDRDWFIDVANFTYNYLHMPFLLLCGALFFFVDLRKYRVLRNSLLLSGFLAIPVYWLFPVTPPRLLHLHTDEQAFVDTVGEERRAIAEFLVNDYAAVPSYHFGWILLLVIGAWWFARSPWVRALAVAFIAWMSVTIVVTANHYFLDMVAGGVLVLVAFLLAYRWERWVEERPGWGQRWLFRRGDYRQPV